MLVCSPTTVFFQLDEVSDFRVRAHVGAAGRRWAYGPICTRGADLRALRDRACFDVRALSPTSTLSSTTLGPIEAPAGRYASLASSQRATGCRNDRLARALRARRPKSSMDP